jgi:UDP:flavonoid glycosyltransferase YjiC (YdhE family)
MGSLQENLEKPILVVTAFNLPGHTAGLMQISEHLAGKGFDIYFITGPDFKASIEKMGAQFVENLWSWQQVSATRPPGFKPTLFSSLQGVFVNSTPQAHRILNETLERVRREHPAREVIIIHESLSSGLAPFLYGAPLPKGYSSLPKIINFHTSIYAARSKEYKLPPFGSPFPYDPHPTPETLAIYDSIHNKMQPDWDDLNAYTNTIFQSLGATRPVTGTFFDQSVSLGDVNVMATSPSLEYPAVQLDPKLRFIGGLPLKPLPPSFVTPVWWPAIAANAALAADSPDKKKVIFVSQGTLSRNYTELVIPAIKTLAEQPNLIVVATLGCRGAELPTDLEIPPNVMVVDYLPYDVLLPYTDVFVSNAGYGGLMHGVMNGVPMVLAGTVSDKAQVCARAEWAGVAVNLRAQRPGEEAIREAVARVLGDGKFKARALELKGENEGLNSLRKVEEIIEELSGRK